MLGRVFDTLYSKKFSKSIFNYFDRVDLKCSIFSVSGVLRHMFDTLYDEDIISEDALIQWEKSEDEPEGKGAALKQVVQFFTWLSQQ